jgi:predicted ATPase
MGAKMVRLRDLGLDEATPKRESVTILVGPNGSGKSSALLKLARIHGRRRKFFVICNTAHDRFTGLRGVQRLSVGNWRQTPKAIVKGAVADALSTESSAFYQISSILEYCSYQPRFGFTIVARHGFEKVWSDRRFLWERYLDLRRRRSNLPLVREVEFSGAIDFLARQDPGRPLWIDATDRVLEFSQSREFANLLRFERLLRDMDLIAGIDVFLRRRDDDQDIEMKNASSGQLALISSLLYLISKVTDDDPVIVVDEPENSLHPKWQQEYVDKLLAALRYRNATIVIATHAPLVVTGALATNREIVSVFEMRNGEAQRLDIEATGSVGSIEEILWRAFDVVTPANHFVSEQIVEAISSFERGEMAKGDVLDLIDGLDGRSFDARQKRYFRTVRGLLDEVDAALDIGGDDA